MAFIKEESEDIRISEVFSIKHEDTEEQTGRLLWLLTFLFKHWILFLLIEEKSLEK